MDAVEARQAQQVVNVYRQLHAYLLQSNRDFASSSQNDANEVITWILNALHVEAGKDVPASMRKQLTDNSSKIILRDFSNRISNILESFVSVVSRRATDNTQIFETFSVLFVDPTTIDQYGAESSSVQEAVGAITFEHIPKCMFISLIMRPLMRCHVPDVLYVRTEVPFYIRSIVFFMPAMAHYITAIRGMLDDQPIWCIINDSSVSFLPGDRFHQLGIPTLLLYEQAQ
jgi:ubiquitin C-terminal hydrolase